MTNQPRPEPLPTPRRPRASWHARGIFGLVLALAVAGRAAEPPSISALFDPYNELLTKPLTLADTLNIGANRNAGILKAKQDLETQYGIAIQLRAIAQPRLIGSADYRAVEEKTFQTFDASELRLPRDGHLSSDGHLSNNDQLWNVGVTLVQSIYEGGRIQASLRSARLLREQAMLDYQTVVADTMLQIRVAYDDALQATNEIVVRESSVALLLKELEDTKRRFDAGIVPQFNVLRAEVEVANARPKLIRARNNYRIAKQRLVNDLGINLPRSVLEDVPLQLADKLSAEPYSIDLSDALDQALEHRTELASLRKNEELRKEGVRTAKSGYKPSVELFIGPGVRNPGEVVLNNLPDSPSVYGWAAGARMTWNIFDGNLTKGKVTEARARHERSLIDLDDVSRRIELEVRTAYSAFIEAREVLDSQQKVNEQAVEALRLANSRYDAGTGTQLDVLSAQTALTDARSTYVQALHDYSVARSRLERATGLSIKVEKNPPKP